MSVKVATAELTGPALDWAVLVCLHGKHDPSNPKHVQHFHNLRAGHPLHQQAYFSTNWAHGGMILDEAGISVIRCDDDWGVDKDGFTNDTRIPVWAASQGQRSVETSTEHQSHEAMYQVGVAECFYGETSLIAAMRCYVASKLGKEVDIPLALANDQVKNADGAIAQPNHTEQESKMNTAAIDRQEQSQKSTRFGIVLLNETKYWNEDIQARAGEIYAAYLFDSNQVTHAAEIEPSYRLAYLYSTSTKGIEDEALQETLLTEGAGNCPEQYVHCRVIDAIPPTHLHWDTEEPIPEYDTYEEVFENAMEKFRGNVMIDIPRALPCENLNDPYASAGWEADFRVSYKMAVDDPEGRAGYYYYPAHGGSGEDIHGPFSSPTAAWKACCGDENILVAGANQEQAEGLSEVEGLSELNFVIDMAQSHVDDIESGLADYTYDAKDNEDFPDKKLALERVRDLAEQFAKHQVLVVPPVEFAHDGDNNARAERICAVIAAHRLAIGDPEEIKRVDDPTKLDLAGLLSDVRHYCDAHGIAYHEADKLAHQHYLEEKQFEREVKSANERDDPAP